jgi:hypothetical protein
MQFFLFLFQLPKQNGRLTKQNGRLLDVIFWIQGGDFYVGSAKDFTPQYLMDKNVVYVSTNYRLGVMGTLYCKTQVANFSITCSKYFPVVFPIITQHFVDCSACEKNM